MNRYVLALVPLAVAQFIAGCTGTPTRPTCGLGVPTSVPANDTTAPTAALDIFLADGRRLSVVGGSSAPTTVSQPPGRFTLIAKAADTDGPKDIQIWVRTRECTTAGTQTSCTGPGLLGAPAASNPSSGAVGSSTCTERIAQINLDVVNTSVRQVTHDITVKAINFGGQVTEITNIKLVAQ
jgi:hypothetical protein